MSFFLSYWKFLENFWLLSIVNSRKNFRFERGKFQTIFCFQSSEKCRKNLLFRSLKFAERNCYFLVEIFERFFPVLRSIVSSVKNYRKNFVFVRSLRDFKKYLFFPSKKFSFLFSKTRKKSWFLSIKIFIRFSNFKNFRKFLVFENFLSIFIQLSRKRLIFSLNLEIKKNFLRSSVKKDPHFF